MCVFRKKTRSLNIPGKIEFNGKSISRAKSIKYLGVTIDEFLNWNEHTQNLNNSLKSHFSVFYNIRDYLASKHSRTIYYTMVYSKIRYGISVYGSTKSENINKVQVLQNRLLKILLGKKWRYPTNNLHNDVDALQIRDIFVQEITSFVCSYLNGKLPVVFEGYFKSFNEIHSYNTRGSANRLLIPQSKTDLGRNTVKVRGCIEWNAISSETKAMKNPKAFKKAFKSEILPYPTS